MKKYKVTITGSIGDRDLIARPIVVEVTYGGNLHWYITETIEAKLEGDKGVPYLVLNNTYIFLQKYNHFTINVEEL